MPWGAVAGAVVGAVANKALAPKSKLGAGETAQTKEPWAEAAPWLKENLAKGQALQAQYEAQPFSAQQQQAYANQYAQSDYMRQLTPSLLNQLQNQQVGFDRDNPRAKPNAFQYGLLADQGAGGGLLAGGGGAGLLGGSMTQAAGQQAAADQAAKEAAAAAAAKTPPGWSWDGNFNQQAEVLNGTNFKDRGDYNALQGAGGFGSFRYGQNAPEAGTAAYRDMEEYFLRGGYDPNNMYGRQKTGAGYINGVPTKPGEMGYYFNQNLV